MLTGLTLMAFGGAAGVSLYSLVCGVSPEMDRIVRALRGEPRARFAPLAHLARAERRIAVRRWSAAAPAMVQQRRAAA